LEFALFAFFHFRHKGAFMKTLRPVLLVLVALLLASAAHAQQTNVQAKVPFDFVVGDQVYPAGDYTIKSLTEDGAALRIANKEDPAAGIAMSNSCSTLEPSDKTKLVFHRLGDQFFLYQVWIEGRDSGREVSKGRVEIRMAKNHSDSKEVIVAANLIR
jgi:hypothetical protein